MNNIYNSADSLGTSRVFLDMAHEAISKSIGLEMTSEQNEKIAKFANRIAFIRMVMVDLEAEMVEFAKTIEK